MSARIIRPAVDETAKSSKPSKGQLIAGTVIAVFAIGALASCLGGGSTAAPAAAAPAPITITQEAPPSVAAAPAAPVEQPAAAPVAVHYMPDVVGMNLQDAQGKIQEAGVFYSRSEDATGQGRMQILDRDWVVLSQNIEPGAAFTEGDAILSVKKVWE